MRNFIFWLFLHFQIRIYDLRFTIYDLRFTIYDLRFTIWNLEFGIWNFLKNRDVALRLRSV
ncbi:MAG TPA: hypothetical protein DDZ79_05510 [Aequorivita sp.]|nr:hypothetical protein [Aequorivita sp.]